MCDQNRRRRRRGAGLCVAGAAALSAVSAPAVAETVLPEPVVKALDLALADERNALATYEAVLERFGDVRPFVNIARAEQRHIDALLPLYARYGVRVPEDETKVDPATATLDMKGLCQVGIEAEIENVRLYDEELLPTVAAYPDIAAVLQRLRDASANNHLQAFQRCVERGGRPGMGQGRGQGKGYGRG